MAIAPGAWPGYASPMDRLARRIRTRKILLAVGAVLIIASAILVIMRFIWDFEFTRLSPFVLLPGTIAVLIGNILNFKIRDESVTAKQPQTPSPSAQQDPPAPR